MSIVRCVHVCECRERSKAYQSKRYPIDTSARHKEFWEFCNELSTVADDHMYIAPYTALYTGRRKAKTARYIHSHTRTNTNTCTPHHTSSITCIEMFWFRITMPSHLMFQTEQFTVWTLTHRTHASARSKTKYTTNSSRELQNTIYTQTHDTTTKKYIYYIADTSGWLLLIKTLVLFVGFLFLFSLRWNNYSAVWLSNSVCC